MSTPSREQWGAIIAPAMLEVICILFAYVWSVASLSDTGDPLREDLFIYLPYFSIFILFWIGASLDERLADPLDISNARSQFSTAIRAVGQALVVSTVAMAIFTDGGIERDFLFYFAVGTLVAVAVSRTVMRFARLSLRRSGLTIRRALIVGANDRAARLVDTMKTRSAYGYAPVGFLEDNAGRCETLEKLKLPRLGGFTDLKRIIAEEAIDEVVVTLPVRSFYEEIQDIAETCEGMNVTARLTADLFPSRIAKNRIVYMDATPLVSLSAVPEERARLAAKRAIDFVISSILLALLSPMFLVVALLVKLTSPGPVFFAQERVGQNQRRFPMLKFRSMVVDAEARRKELEALNEAKGPVFKIKNDPRLTPIGGFIRKYSIDEFPQLINVWLGQMSLVGPRPPIASEVEQYTWNQRRRLSVKPGMTGLWQISGRSEIAFDQWVELDLEYIDTWSLANDFLILLKTFRAVVEGRGAA